MREFGFRDTHACLHRTCSSSHTMKNFGLSAHSHTNTQADWQSGVKQRVYRLPFSLIAQLWSQWVSRPKATAVKVSCCLRIHVVQREVYWKTTWQQCRSEGCFKPWIRLNDSVFKGSSSTSFESATKEKQFSITSYLRFWRYNCCCQAGFWTVPELVCELLFIIFPWGHSYWAGSELSQSYYVHLKRNSPFTSRYWCFFQFCWQHHKLHSLTHTRSVSIESVQCLFPSMYTITHQWARQGHCGSDSCPRTLPAMDCEARKQTTYSSGRWLLYFLSNGQQRKVQLTRKHTERKQTQAFIYQVVKMSLQSGVFWLYGLSSSDRP